MAERNDVSSVSETTSSVTVLSSPHGRQRRHERNISKRDLQAAVKYGRREPGIPNHRTGEATWKYTFCDIVYVTDATSRVEITSWPVPGVGIDVELREVTPAMKREHNDAKANIHANPAYWTSHTVVSAASS